MQARLYSLIIFFIIITSIADAQVIRIDSLSNWRKAFKAGLNLNQAAFSGNWKAGGVNSFGFNALMNYKAGFKKDKNAWDNEIDLLYGMINNSGQGYRKTVDRIFINTQYGRMLDSLWDFTAAINLQSQFAKGYSYAKDSTGAERGTIISDAFAPAFITAAFGFEYHPKPWFKVRISPIAPRVTLVRNVERFVTADNPTPYGVQPGKSARFEWAAAQVLAEFDKDIVKNVNLKWRYLLFANYETLRWKTLDHRLDVNLTAKVNRFINVSIGGILLYDYDQDPGTQWSQVFSLGMLYTIQNYEDKEEVIIREITASDVPELLTLATKVFRDTFTHNNTPEAMEGFIAKDYTLEKFQSEFGEAGTRTFFMCDDNGKAVAYLRVRRNSEADHYLGTNNIELQRLYVDHTYHGLKIADEAMQLAIDIAKENKHDWIWLGVWEHNPRAQRFYQKWGFERFSEHDFYMGEERQTDWLMRKRIND